MTEDFEPAKGKAKVDRLSSERFDQTSIVLHWLTVVLIAVQFSSVWLRKAVDRDSDAATTLLTMHISSGASIWIVGVARLIWRHNYAYLPPFPDSMPRFQQTIAKANEYGLYALLLIQPITGIGRVLLRGSSFHIFIWKVPALFKADDAVLHFLAEAHEFGAGALVALIGLHAGAALFHYFVLRDGVLQRMSPWTSQPVRPRETDAKLATGDAE